MKSLTILGRTVTIDTDKLSAGLCKLHEQDENKKAVLAFGMLDFKLCEMFDNILKESVLKQFSELAYLLSEDEINDFIKDCQNEVGKGVYKYATLIV
jgi:hypothetical protein